MTSDASLLRELIETVLADHDDFAARFYTRLFERHPSTREMFRRNSPDAQQKLFTKKLVMLIDSLEDERTFTRELAEVATTHAAYGVQPQMYAWVGDVLAEVLAECAGPAWSPAVADALGRAWLAMSSVVLGHQAPAT